MGALDCGLVACQDHHRGHRGQQVCAGNLQTARQAAFPVVVGYRVASSPSMLDVTACAFAPTTTSTCAGATSPPIAPRDVPGSRPAG